MKLIEPKLAELGAVFVGQLDLTYEETETTKSS